MTIWGGYGCSGVYNEAAVAGMSLIERRGVGYGVFNTILEFSGSLTKGIYYEVSIIYFLCFQDNAALINPHIRAGN